MQIPGPLPANPEERIASGIWEGAGLPGLEPMSFILGWRGGVGDF
jgi:hypothetical protein